jgi:hypothetical protein
MYNAEHRQPSVAGKRAILTLAMLLLGGATAAQATTIDDIRVEGWYGTGVNKAVLVVDFAPGNGDADSFAFGVNFGATSTDTITGYNLLQTASSGNGSLGFDSHSDPLWGWMLDEIWYTDPKTSQSYDVRNNWPAAWWSYWTSTDGSTWSSSDVGASSRMVGSGDIDGWVAQVGDVWPGTPPVAPMNAVPEPSTLVLALAGGLAVLVCRCRRRAR